MQQKISEYVTLASKSSKEVLKNEIDRLKWDLIESTIEDRGEVNKLKEIKILGREALNLFIWKLEFGEVFKENDGFNIIIANPPYIKENTNKKAFDDLRDSLITKENGFMVFVCMH